MVAGRGGGEEAERERILFLGIYFFSKLKAMEL